MEGRGVTNYATDKPSFAFSTSTTEFDDELIKRGIVTLEQAFLAKGAPPEEAARLASVKRNQQDNVASIENEGTFQGDQKKEAESDQESETSTDFDDGEDFENDEFMVNYRRERLEQLKNQPRGPFGQVIPISRPDWSREVNEGSAEAWVVVTLTSGNVERTGCVEDAVTKLARKFPRVKFVTIPSNAAIADWPDENLPTIFLYRDGSLQTELIRLNSAITADELEWKMAECGVLETDLNDDPTNYRDVAHSRRIMGSLAHPHELRRDDSDEEDDDSWGT